MIVNEVVIRENPFLSVEEFEKIHFRKPQKLKIKLSSPEKDYSKYSRSTEAFFGENNEYKIGMTTLMGELRSLYNEAIDTSNDKKVRRINSANLLKTLDKIEKLVEKVFNIKKCYFGLIDDLNAWSIPLCFDSKLVTKEKKRYRINNKAIVSLEDIMETKNGYKYKDKEDKIYCVSFGIHFFDKDKKGNDLFTDEECAAIMAHEFGHAMQQAVCSINENLASVYMKALFQDIYALLNPLVVAGSFGLSLIVALIEGHSMNKIKKNGPENTGKEIFLTHIAPNRKEFDREYMGDEIDTNTKRLVKDLPKQKNHPIQKFFAKFISFTIGGLVQILNNLCANILNAPSNLFALFNSKQLKKDRRFEQFADVFAASYGLGPAQASALAKLGNLCGYKQDYGILGLINYVPLANLVIGASQYTNQSISQLINGYPDMTGRMAAMYKSLKNDLENNKDLSPEDKKTIQDQIDSMNEIYNDYVYDWSPKGFVYALFHKVRFKSLKNEKTDVEKNVLEALQELSKEKKLTAKSNKEKSDDITSSDIDSTVSTSKLLSLMLTAVKSLKTSYGTSTKNMINEIEPKLRTL